MKIMRRTAILVLSAVILLFSAAGCGGNDVKINSVGDNAKSAEEFAEEYFTVSNLPYTRLTEFDVQNTPDEYLFYVKDGVVYRTLNDYVVVIVVRSALNEEEDRRGTDYSGELIPLFEGDSIDMLRICAAGDYALLTMPQTVPDWANDQVINAFMEYASSKKSTDLK